MGRFTGHGINVNIITNGYIFREELISDLKKLCIESVSVSIDGSEEIHDKYRQPGSYECAIDAVRALCEAGIPVSVISTPNHENAEYLVALYETLKAYPIFAW